MLIPVVKYGLEKVTAYLIWLVLDNKTNKDTESHVSEGQWLLYQIWLTLLAIQMLHWPKDQKNSTEAQ